MAPDGANHHPTFSNPQALGLKEGAKACGVIKASSVMIGMDD